MRAVRLRKLRQPDSRRTVFGGSTSRISSSRASCDADVAPQVGHPGFAIVATDMKTKAFVLHLERARNRRRLARDLAASLPIPTAIIRAVDGKKLSQADVHRFYQPRLHAPYYPFPLRNTEIGCFLSHRRAWESILAEGCDAGLVVEDDVHVESDALDELLRAAIAAMRPEEYIRFPVRERGEFGTITQTAGGVSLLEPHLPGLGMQMQLVGCEAARRLLEASETFDRPVDSLVQMQWIHKARVLSARPIVVRELGAACGSTVQQKSAGLITKISHEVQRPLLRLSIRIANDRWRRRAAA